MCRTVSSAAAATSKSGIAGARCWSRSASSAGVSQGYFVPGGPGHRGGYAGLWPGAGHSAVGGGDAIAGAGRRVDDADRARRIVQHGLSHGAQVHAGHAARPRQPTKSSCASAAAASRAVRGATNVKDVAPKVP